MLIKVNNNLFYTKDDEVKKAIGEMSKTIRTIEKQINVLSEIANYDDETKTLIIETNAKIDIMRTMLIEGLKLDKRVMPLPIVINN